METIYFENHELQCHCGCGENQMDPDFFVAQTSSLCFQSECLL